MQALSRLFELVRYPNKMIQPTPERVDLKAINYRASDGLLLDGFLNYPSGRTTASKVGVVFVHGTRGNALVGAGFLAQHLARYGYTTLSINMRSSGINYEISLFEEVVKDLAGAVKYITGLGVKKVVLLGHSLGAVDITYYMATETDPSVAALILSGAPANIPKRAVEEFKIINRSDPRKEYAHFVNKAKRLVKQGKGETILIAPTGGGHGQMPMSAESFLSYRGPDSKCKALAWISNVKLPLFFLFHERPDRGVTPEDSEELIRAAKNVSSIGKYLVRDADHFYTGHEEEASKAILDWLRHARLVP
ncbi:MAG: alpha/beta fold hydrolase [Thaumarchaeota archaeon]|nr:alpha/beta fold hydrolase [Nitrososphaerota archaeon]